MLRSSLKEVDELVHRVAAEADALAPVQAARYAVIDSSEEFLLTVRDENQRRLLPNTVKHRENHGIPPNMIQYVQPNRIRRDASVSC